MSWTVVIPLNAPALRKTRLASLPQRFELAQAMYEHVLACAESVFERVVTLSPATEGPKHWRQHERDLNDELTRVRSGPLIVLNADLPLLTREDLMALADAGRAGCALAADRHGLGTNAVAVMPGARFSFAFGPGSLAAHLRWTENVVVRRGLACDLDTPADLEHAIRESPTRMRALLGRAEWFHAAE